jgi:nucleotide-binding universal stress UspA family protein
MKVLLAIDDSEPSQVATRMVIEQVVPGKTEVRVLNVVRPPTLLVAREMVGYDPALENRWELQLEAATNMVENLCERLRANGVKASSSIEIGEPRAKILEVADKWHADLIVMGSDRRTRLTEYLPGGIPEAVARRAHCSIEIVRAPQEETKRKGLNS